MNSIFRDHILKDKVAFITGGSSGICLGIAEAFAAQGTKLMLLGRSQDKLDAAIAGIESSGGTASGHAADVRNYAALEEALPRLVRYMARSTS